MKSLETIAEAIAGYAIGLVTVAIAAVGALVAVGSMRRYVRNKYM
jgi:hypothetical protein